MSKTLAPPISMVILVLAGLAVSRASAASSFNAEQHFAPLMETYAAGGSALTQEQFEAFFSQMFAEVEDPHAGHNHKALSLTRQDNAACHAASEVFDAYDANGDSMLQAEELVQSSSSLYLMVLDGCRSATVEENVTEVMLNGTAVLLEEGELWGYSIASAVVISLASLVGLLVAPLTNVKEFPRVFDALLGFGVGSIVGHVVLYSFPLVAGSSTHAYLLAAETAVLPPQGEFDYIWPIAFMMLAFGLIFVLERVVEEAKPEKQQSDSHQAMHHAEFEVAKTTPTPRLLTPMAYIIIVTSVFFNLAVGLNIGGAWGVSASVGLATSLTLLIQQLLIELAFFLAFLRAGFSIKGALLTNLALCIVLFIATIIGAGAHATVALSQRWMMALSTACLFYLGLSSVSHYVAHGHHKPIPHIIIAGITMGVAIGLQVLMAAVPITVTV